MNEDRRNELVRCPACDASSTGVTVTVHGYPVHRCECGLRFVPEESISAVDYNDLYAAEGTYKDKLEVVGPDAVLRLPKLGRARRLALRAVTGLRGGAALDVGCGTGGWLATLKPLGFALFGCDMSSNAIEAAHRRLPEAVLRTGSYSPEQFGAQRFAVVSSWEVLEHVADPKAFLHDLHQALDDGGLLFLSTPNCESRVMWRDVRHDPRSAPPLHRTFWTQRALQTALERAGFRQVSVTRVSYPAGGVRRCGTWFERWMYKAECLLRPRERRTLFVRAQK